MSEVSTAIVPAVKPETAAIMAMGGVGLEDTFIKPTYVELLQRTTTRKDVHPGKLYDVLTQTEFESIEVVPLAIKRGRVLFPEDGTLGSKPLCRSDDGIEPSPFAQFPQNSTCKGCPKGSWDNYDRKTGKGKPACKEAWSLLAVMRENGLPRKIKISGMSIKPIKNLLEQLKQDVVMSRAKGEVRNFFDYKFVIGVQTIEGSKGTYFVLKFTDVKRIAQPGEFGPMFETYVLSAKARQAEAEEARVSAEAVEEAVADVVEV